MAALELGYYDISRTATHEDVTAATDAAPITAGITADVVGHLC